MIYKNTTPPIALYGADADNFLESCGIELYEDSIAIGESLFDGYDGECLLNENGIFLYEDGIVLEGEQAERYLKDKQDRITKERNNEIKKSAEKYGGNTARIYYTQGPRSVGTDNDGNVYTYNSGKGWDRNTSASNNPAYKSAQKMREYRSKYPDAMPKTKSKNEKELERVEAKERAAVKYGYDIASKHVDPKNDVKFQTAADAARRHYRRTHKNESTIFDSIKIV